MTEFHKFCKECGKRNRYFLFNCIAIIILMVITSVNFYILFPKRLERFEIKHNATYDEADNSSSVSLIDAYIEYHGDDMKFIPDVYDCTNYTEYFLNWSKNMGFYCQKVIGCPLNTSDNICHAYVTCAIEPQSFRFVNYNKMYPLQWIERGTE